MEGGAPEEFQLAIETAIVAPEAFGASFDAAPSRDELEFGGELEGDPAIAFRRTLGMFATGVTVITTQVGEQVHGMTVNAFMSVSLSPPLVLISVDRRARMHGILHEGKRYGISVLADEQVGLSEHFAGRSPDGEARFVAVHDTPLVDGAVAQLVARVVRSYWGGDHSLFLGQVEYARYGEGRPLLFHGGRYERIAGETQVLAALPPELLEPILAHGTERVFEDGEALMRRGEPGEELYLLLEGSVRVERPGRSLMLEAGDVVGEIEVLDGRGRIADVTAEGPVRAIAVSRVDLRTALWAEPRAAWELLEILAGRFRETA